MCVYIHTYIYMYVYGSIFLSEERGKRRNESRLVTEKVSSLRYYSRFSRRSKS